MTTAVQARLDNDTAKILDDLVHRLGWNPSQVVREGIRLVAASQPSAKKPRIIGQGEFSSGVPGLGSDNRHLKGFGR